MRRKGVRALWMAAVLACGVPAAAYGQEDAAAAFRAGKAAFEAGQFDKAREQFRAASQTDNKNPEAFLWLGKAEYQLGQVDAAIAAWRQTAALAPAEPYSNQMLKALTGRATDADTQLSVVRAMLADELWDASVAAADRLLADRALTDAQRVQAVTLRAQGLLGAGRAADALAAATELQVKYPTLVDPAEVKTLIGRAKLRTGDARMGEGVALLQDVVAKHANTPAAAVAHFELLAFQLEQGVEAARVEPLAKWVSEHAEHDRANAARRRLVEAHLALAARGGEPGRAAKLSPADTAALDAAAQFFKRTAGADQAVAVTTRIVQHLTDHYAKRGALAAAKAGAEALLKNELPPASRAVVLRAQAGFTADLAVRDLAEQVAAGKVEGAAGALPGGLAEAVALYAAINKEPAGGGAWKEQAALAERVRELGAQLPWPAKVTEIKVPLAWAVQVAMPVVQAGADAAAVASAAKTVTAVADEVARAEANDPKGLALSVNGPLLAALPADRPQWAEAAWRQVDLLDVAAAALFRQNVRDGKTAENAKLSKPQQDLIAVLGQVVKTQASAAPRAFERLNAHLQPWMTFGQYVTAEAAYGQLAASLPESHRRQVELALVNLWVRRAIGEHNRLIAAGLTVPAELDPQLAKAMRRLYEMQDALAPEDPFLAQVRSLAASIIHHYERLKYPAAAEAAARAKPEGEGAKPSSAGDTFAQFQLARLKEQAARAELSAVVGKFGGVKKLAVSEGMKAAIAAHTQFVADHPVDPLAEQSVAAVFAIAETFQRYGAHDAAGQIYRDLAAFAAKRPALSQASPGTPSLEERAAFAAIGAAESKAQAALAAVRAAEKGEIKPPAKISDEYAAALAAYEEFIKARPGSPLVGPAITRVMAIALDWARVDAWDVADGVYAVLLKPELKTRDPERIEFARGVCQVGKVMPDHAREVLAALTAGQDAGGPATQPNEVSDLVPTTRPTAATGVASGGRQFRGGGFGVGGGAGIGAGGPGSSEGGTRPADGFFAYDPAGGKESPAGGPLAPPVVAAEGDLAKADRQVLAAISSQEARRASMVAQMRENSASFTAPRRMPKPQQAGQQPNMPPTPDSAPAPAPPVLSEAEIARQAAALDAAYKIFQGIRTKSSATRTAGQARGEILVIVGHWRVVNQWKRAAELARAFLTDNPADPELPQLRLGIAQDTLTWAAQLVDPTAAGGGNKQQVLTEVGKRFDAARGELGKIVAEFPDERQLRQDAQWQLATSFLTQAHTVGAYSPTLVRGQYVRAVKEMQRAAGEYYDHPQVATIPQILWDVSQELASRGFSEEAISVWNDLSVNHPQSPLAQQAAVQMAETYRSRLGRPLRAAEVYLEINFARGGADPAAANNIYQIGAELKAQNRWVESLHVLSTFVASFPKHAQAGQALTMIGQIHQTNEAWADAIGAYQRVTTEFADKGEWVQEARWAIAECTINLSRWREAIGAYQSFVTSYPQDARLPEANRRTGVLKDLAKYQQLVDENGAKAFDAQFQIAQIVQAQLANPTKAVSEYRQVARKWPASHLADDALYQVGMAYLQLGKTEQAREAMAGMATRYPESPLADDALLAIGKSYEDETQRIAGLTREQQLDFNKDVAQKNAYSRVNEGRAAQRQVQQARVQVLRQQGKGQQAELEEGKIANGNFLWDNANVSMAAEQARQDVESLTASQLADRQDKINASLRKAVESYAAAAKVPGADRAGEALLRVATIQGERLHDSQAAMATWLEIVRQFSGTAVAEEASWRIAQNYERDAKYADAIDAYKAFLRNYRGSTRAADAQFAVAEGYEHLGDWVKAMDSYGNYVNSFPQGTMVQKAKEQITWIKTYRL